MTDPKAPQQTTNANFQQPLEEETTFIDILTILVKEKLLIIVITSLGAFLSFSYYFLATPIYKADISFLPPFQEIDLPKIAPNLLTRTIDASSGNKNLVSSPNIWANLNSNNFLYRQFLTKVQSFSLQKEVLNNEKFLKGFFGNSYDPENLNQELISLRNRISLKISSIQKYTKKTIELDIPTHLEIVGPDPIVMAEFLNRLADSAKAATISETQYALQTLIDNQLKFAKRHKKFLRLIANENHKKKLQLFSDSLKIAQNLNIKNNNFHLLKIIKEGANGIEAKRGKVFQKGLAKANKDGIIPNWYLYGEKALIEELKILNSRTNQFLSDSREIAQNQNIKNSNSDLLETNNVIYSEELAYLEDHIKQLQSLNISAFLPNVVSIDQPSIPPVKPINLKIIKVFSTGIGLGLLFGIIAAFLSHAMWILRDRSS
jgi:LPS O-antigen subunit length determinant protein (WzzB/FepE family)